MKFLALLPLLLLSLAAPADEGPLSPDQELSRFRIEPGLLIERVAAEPLVHSPAALAWDEHGRLFVAENPGYPVGDAPGAIVQLADRDGDGQADARIPFAEGFGFPNGLMPWRGGWLVTDAPNLWWLADTNADGRADLREIWFTGFATNQTTQLRACYPTFGPDGWIYLARGLSGGTVTSPKWPHLPPVDLKGGDFRFRPDGSRAETIGGNTQFGMVLDDVGRRFLVSNRNPLMHAVVPPAWWARHPNLPFADLVQDVSPTGYEAKVHPLSPDTTTAGFMPEFLAAPHAGSFTAACGIHAFHGEALPSSYQASWFICEPAQNLVQRQIAESSGPTFRSHRVPDDTEFLASTDGWFRPVCSATGPDGALYIADLYRKIIDHPQYLPADIRDKLDFGAGKDLGRIWRVRTARSATPRPRPIPDSVSGRIEALATPNVWTRATAHRLLAERADPEVISVLVDTLDRDPLLPTAFQDDKAPERLAFDPLTGPHLGTARRLRLLAELLGDPENPPQSLRDARQKAVFTIFRATFSPSPTVRETAWRILQSTLRDPKHALPDVSYEIIYQWADDPSPAVRFHFALLCGSQADWTPVIPALLRIARRDSGDRWTRAAVLSGLRNREAEFVRKLFEQPIPDTDAMADLLGDLAGLCAGTPGPAEILLLEQALAPQHAETAWSMSVLLRSAEALRARDRITLRSFLERYSAASGERGARLDRLDAAGQRMNRMAGNPAEPAAKRLHAVRFLSEIPFQDAQASLTAALAPGQTADLQLAAVRTLGRFDDPAAGRLLLDPKRWPDLPQPVRSAAIAAVAERTTLVPVLLDSLESGALPIWVVEPQRRRSLQSHANPAIRDRALRLFAQAGGEDRRRIFESLKPVLDLPAVGARGREVFLKSCATCHRHGTDGTAVGPDLSGVRNQPPEALLLHIIVPDAEIYPGYQACEVETTDGRSLTGLLVSETPQAIVLRRAGGEQETLARSGIRSVALSRVSLMPQELEKTMSRQDLADLLAFLRDRP